VLCVVIDGDVYEGEMANGDFNGRGIMRHANGSHVCTCCAWSEPCALFFDFTNDVSILSRVGARYEGEFKADKKEGTGTFYFQNGDRYGTSLVLWFCSFLAAVLAFPSGF
jgi:hypothetical protein